MVVPLSASAAPGAPPANSSDPVTQYKQLALQAEVLDEKLLNAQSDLKTKQAQLATANAQLAAAKQAEQQALATEGKFQGQVDQFAAASFNGARLNQLSALLTGTSAQDFLNRATLLNEVASSNDAAMNDLAKAVTQATAAEHTAAAAQQQSQSDTAAATKLVSDITTQQTALNSQIATVKAAMAKLTTTQQAALSSGSSNATFIGPPGVLNTVLQAALSRRGDEYVWGATGPTTFDCSGLTLWSYQQGGISLPRTAQEQYGVGTYVPYGQWQPGDLIFYGTSSNIHHVAMYVGNGQIVQAPTTGIPVQVVPVSGGGSDYYGAKRITG
jgi:cell wall-associated NlpC family hydrolase